MKVMTVEIQSSAELRAAMRNINQKLGKRGVAFVRFPDGTLAARRDKRGIWKDFSPSGKDSRSSGVNAAAWGARE